MKQTNSLIQPTCPWTFMRALALQKRGDNISVFDAQIDEKAMFSLSHFEKDQLFKHGILEQSVIDEFKMTPWLLKTPSYHLLLGREASLNIEELRRKTCLKAGFDQVSKDDWSKLEHDFFKWFLFNGDKKEKKNFHQVWFNSFSRSSLFKALYPLTQFIPIEDKQELVELLVALKLKEEHWLLTEITLEEAFYYLIQLVNPWWEISYKTLSYYLLSQLKVTPLNFLEQIKSSSIFEVSIQSDNLKDFNLQMLGDFEILKNTTQDFVVPVGWLGDVANKLSSNKVKPILGSFLDERQFVFRHKKEMSLDLKLQLSLKDHPGLPVRLSNPLRYLPYGRWSFIQHDLLFQ